MPKIVGKCIYVNWNVRGGGVPWKNIFVGMVSIISGNTLLLINVTYIK